MAFYDQDRRAAHIKILEKGLMNPVALAEFLMLMRMIEQLEVRIEHLESELAEIESKDVAHE